MAPQPNILFIIDDQHRWDYLQAFQPWLRTPNLQRLMDQGLTYRHCFAPVPLCMPARYLLHNGLYGHQSGLVRNEGTWRFGIPTLPRALQGAGYETALFGKCHAHEPLYAKRFDGHLRSQQATDDVHALGYDHVDQVSGKVFAWLIECPYTRYLHEHGLLDAYRAEGERLRGGGSLAPSVLPTEHNIDVYITDRITRWLGSRDGGRPFFLWAGLCAPHGPLDPPRELAAHYSDADIPPPVGHPDPAAVRIEQVHYAAQVELIDQQVGRILDALDRSGQADNTLVIFAADHGNLLGDHGKRGKAEPWEASVRVPCILRWPDRIPAGVVSDALIDQTDLVATFHHVGTGEAQPSISLPKAPGRSLLGHWRAPAESFREAIYAEGGGFPPNHPPFQMIRTDTCKYVFYPEDGREQLFDLSDDATERQDLSAEPSALASREAMRSRLLTHLAQTLPPV